VCRSPSAGRLDAPARIDIVGEFRFGNRIDKDGRRGSSSQLQLGSNFRF
jgi:hypothetical protein